MKILKALDDLLFAHIAALNELGYDPDVQPAVRRAREAIREETKERLIEAAAWLSVGDKSRQDECLARFYPADTEELLVYQRYMFKARDVVTEAVRRLEAWQEKSQA